MIEKLQGKIKAKAELLEDWEKRKQLAEIKNKLAIKYGKCVNDVQLPMQMSETMRELRAVKKMQ